MSKTSHFDIQYRWDDIATWILTLFIKYENLPTSLIKKKLKKKDDWYFNNFVLSIMLIGELCHIVTKE